MLEQLAELVQDGVGGDVDDRVDQVVAVFEIMVELAAACAGAFPDIVQAHAGCALLCDEFSGSLQDSLARRASLRRCGSGLIRHV